MMTCKLQELLIKLQQLTEPMKGELDDQSTLRSELAKNKMVVLELRKENEVNVCN